jgi:succinoglycan biosynthesis protein ExoM
MNNNICIAISTNKRKKNLLKLLESIKSLKKIDLNNVQILIVANDKGNYKDLSSIFKNKLKIRVIRESNKGLSFVRNKLLKEIRKVNYKYIAFLDDDCEIDKYWFIEMINMFKKTSADIIGGPQLSKSTSLYSKLLIRNEKHKSTISWASTNNVIMKYKILKTNINFSKKLNLIGGEDQLFFLKLSRAGFKIKWNAKAKVIEQENTNRENFLWFLRRNFRYGASSNLIYNEAYGYIGGISILIGKLSLDLVKMIFYLIISVNLSKKNFYKFIMYFCRVTGLIFGLLGIQYKEYA